MARVTDEEVKEIIETTITTTPFITAANLVVTSRLGDQGIDDDLLKEIERWFAAHLVAIREPQAKTEKTGDTGVTYFGKDGTGLDATPYGQQVKVLDPTGLMATLGSRAAEMKAFELFD